MIESRRRFHRTCFYASWSLHPPTRDVSPIHWSDYTHYSERVHAEGIPKAFNAARVPEEELNDSLALKNVDRNLSVTFLIYENKYYN